MNDIVEGDDLAGVDVGNHRGPRREDQEHHPCAILLLGGNKGGDARDILEPFDFWRITTNVEKIAKAPAPSDLW